MAKSAIITVGSYTLGIKTVVTDLSNNDVVKLQVSATFKSKKFMCFGFDNPYFIINTYQSKTLWGT
jgi:hypothetical protein